MQKIGQQVWKCDPSQKSVPKNLFNWKWMEMIALNVVYWSKMYELPELNMLDTPFITPWLWHKDAVGMTQAPPSSNSDVMSLFEYVKH